MGPSCAMSKAVEIIKEDFGWEDEVFLSFLPLSHAYEHSGGLYLPIGLGGQIAYAESLEKLAGNIEEIRPTIMVVVPRLFEVLRTRIMKQVEKQGKVPQALMRRALALGAKEMGGGLKLCEHAVQSLPLQDVGPIQARFGGRMKAMVSGGAPLNPDIGIFFHSIGIHPAARLWPDQITGGFVQPPQAGIKMDTVGPPMKGVEVRIAEDGEILVRGELVMHGYWRNDAETARAVQDGWLHTGDIGEFDPRAVSGSRTARKTSSSMTRARISARRRLKGC